MKPWHEEDSFWTKFAPVMFHQGRLEKAKEEVGNIISLLGVSPDASILDLCCGPGRHSLELARRDFKVTGVDRTKTYLDKARKLAKKEHLKAKFIQKDMREFCVPNTFNAAINLFTSFGYFEDHKDDEKVLRNVSRSLKRKGIFLIDTMGKEVLARIVRERDWLEIDGNIILEERKVCKDWTWIESRWVLLKDGKREEYTVSHRLYSAAELSLLLKQIGFKQIEVYGDLAGAPYDHTARRLVAVAHKG
ncbi:MAG: methyltransferase domain-containing protein [Candidatus Zixiibacteriota bacterium]